MKNEIKQLKVLGANVEVVEGGLKLIGNWNDKYNLYHYLFVEITGSLYTSNSVQDKDFLKGLKSLGDLYTNYKVQDKDFLRGLKSLGDLYTTNSVQDKDFLKGLKSLGYLNTYNSVQDKDFLRGLNSLGYLDTYKVQDKDFLSNLNSLGSLYTSNIVQHKDFLKDLKSLGYLNTSNSVQDKDFLRGLNSLGYLDTSNVVQDKDFLSNLNSLGSLYTSNAVQHKDFLKGLKSLGDLYTTYAVQHKYFLGNSTDRFELPLIYADGILSIVKSEKVVDGVTVYLTNRIGYLNDEYIATDGKVYAHAKNLKLALIDLRFKKSKRDVSWLKDKSINDTLSFDESILAYRCITGACSGGIETFLTNKSVNEKSYRINEIIELTENEYGGKEFRNFFKNL